MSKFCNNCGREVSDESRFCAGCGYEFPVQAEQVTNAQQSTQYGDGYNAQPYNNQYAAPNYVQQPVQPVQYAVKPKIPGRGFGIASMVLGIIAMVYGFVLLMMALSASSITEITNNYSSFTSSAVLLGYKIVLIVYTVFDVFDGILAVLSLIFGLVSLKRGYKKQNIAGLIMAGLCIIICIVSVVVAISIKAPSVSDLSDSYSKFYDYGNNFSSSLSGLLDGLLD